MSLLLQQNDFFDYAEWSKEVIENQELENLSAQKKIDIMLSCQTVVLKNGKKCVPLDMLRTKIISNDFLQAIAEQKPLYRDAFFYKLLYNPYLEEEGIRFIASFNLSGYCYDILAERLSAIAINDNLTSKAS